MFEERKAARARQQQAQGRKKRVAKALKADERARRALASQALPTSWVDGALNRDQIRRLAACVDADGKVAASVVEVVRAVRAEFFEQYKATDAADDAAEATET